MGKKKLQGKRFIALARCSSPGQADTSLDEQLRLIERFGREQGMVCVDRVRLDVTGSVPGARSDLDELIRRKKEQDDFDIVLIQDASRLTRSGPAHGMHVLFELRSVGAEVVSVKDDLPEGDMGDVMRTLQYYSAKQQAESIAFASTRGASASLYMGKTAHCKAPPFGIDRLYCSEDGQPKHIIRNLPDGTQVKLHPQTGEVIERFGRNEKTGVPAHYIKQKTERIRLVAGDPERLRIVREIFERHLTEGWGYFRIAQHLNDQGVVSSRGGHWSIATVRAILFNTVYLGTGIANLATTAIYYQRGPDGPVAAATELKDLVSGRPARRVRPRTDWFERDEPALTDLLNPSLKTAASAKQSVRLEAIAAGLPVKRNRDRHRDSSYILKGILTAKQGGHVMTGRTTGKKNCPMRYYSVSRAYSHPNSDKLLRTLIPAEPIEQVMVTLLQEVLMNCEQVHELLRRIADRELRAQRSPQSDLADLNRERTSLERKLTFVLDELDSESRDAVRAKVQEIQRRLKQVKAEIKARSQDRQKVEDPDAIADVICGRMNDLAEQVPSLSPTAVRNLLTTFVTKLVVDLETRHFEVVFAMPQWATVASEWLCLVGDSAYKTTNEAHPVYVLATYRGVWERTGRNYKVRQVRSHRTAA